MLEPSNKHNHLELESGVVSYEMETGHEQNVEVQPVNQKKRIAFFSLVALVLVALGVASTSASSQAMSPLK